MHDETGYTLWVLALAGAVMLCGGALGMWRLQRRRRDWIPGYGLVVGTVYERGYHQRINVIERRDGLGRMFRARGAFAPRHPPAGGYPYPTRILVDPADESRFVENPDTFTYYRAPLTSLLVALPFVLLVAVLGGVWHLVGLV